MNNIFYFSRPCRFVAVSHSILKYVSIIIINERVFFFFVKEKANKTTWLISDLYYVFMHRVKHFLKNALFYKIIL